jgi:hypothetical protein
VSELVCQAFRAIGQPGPDYRQTVALVAKAIRESGDEEALALFQPPGGEYFDHEAYHAVERSQSRPARTACGRGPVHRDGPGWMAAVPQL